MYLGTTLFSVRIQIYMEYDDDLGHFMDIIKAKLGQPVVVTRMMSDDSVPHE